MDGWLAGGLVGWMDVGCVGWVGWVGWGRVGIQYILVPLREFGPLFWPLRRPDDVPSCKPQNHDAGVPELGMSTPSSSPKREKMVVLIMGH